MSLRRYKIDAKYCYRQPLRLAYVGLESIGESVYRITKGMVVLDLGCDVVPRKSIDW